MCGICGIINRVENVNSAKVKEMSDSIAHRGPDGEGVWVSYNGVVGLGHRRLSILDLSTAGSQPMHYRDRYSIVFNGEIYNYIELKEELLKQGYQFSSHADTEVLLALYDKHKEECLSYLDGMFSFAIYDSREDVLFCARDRFGEKPFFYSYKENKRFFFGSEMKALWTAGVQKGVNQRMLFNYISFGHLQNPSDLSETFYENILRLEAAHYIKVDCLQCKITEKKKYWKLSIAEDNTITEARAAETFNDLFYDSVKKRLRSDVPVGSSLSGGLDSSLVVMTIDKIKKGTSQVQKTFSARFPGFIKDEGKYMDMVINRCNVEPHFTYPSDDSMISEIEKIFFHQEEPFGSASICAQYEVMKLARENEVIVLLDGQGADEILAGYHSYYSVFFSELKKTTPAHFRREVQSYRDKHKKSSINPIQEKSIKYYARQYGGIAFDIAKKIHKKYKRASNPELNTEFFKSFEASAFINSPVFTTLNESLLWSTSKIGLEQLLRYADRNSMAHGIEVRLPFLNHKLVEFLFTLPPGFKIHDGWTKWIMRKAVSGFLPDEITWRKDKIGYEPPQGKWMENKMITELIQHKRENLVKNKILHPRILSTPILPEHSGERQNSNSWTHWMAGNLYS